jgi:hypothetical protein
VAEVLLDREGGGMRVEEEVPEPKLDEVEPVALPKILP